MDLYYYPLEHLYTPAKQLADAGYSKAARTIFRTLESLYHTGITANNLAAFYETYSKNASRQVKHYYHVSFKRRPNIKAACALANIAFNEKQYKQALHYYKIAYHIRKRPEICYNIAVQYNQLTEYRKAIFYISNAIPNLRERYLRDAYVLVVYMYAIIGDKVKAREYFDRYIICYGEADIDLMYLAYLCERYDYIDRHCLSLSQKEEFTLHDAALVIWVLKLLEKGKLAEYFVDKLARNPFYCGNIHWMKQCWEVYERLEEEKVFIYQPALHIDIIKHSKFYMPKKRLPF